MDSRTGHRKFTEKAHTCHTHTAILPGQVQVVPTHRSITASRYRTWWSSVIWTRVPFHTVEQWFDPHVRALLSERDTITSGPATCDTHGNVRREMGEPCKRAHMPIRAGIPGEETECRQATHPDHQTRSHGHKKSTKHHGHPRPPEALDEHRMRDGVIHSGSKATSARGRGELDVDVYVTTTQTSSPRHGGVPRPSGYPQRRETATAGGRLPSPKESTCRQPRLEPARQAHVLCVPNSCSAPAPCSSACACGEVMAGHHLSSRKI